MITTSPLNPGTMFQTQPTPPGPTSPAPAPFIPPTHDGQFTTLGEAAQIAGIINSLPNPPGGGVADWTPDAETSGIYSQTYSGPYPTPTDGSRVLYCFRFRNGRANVNAGIVAGIMAFSPRWPEMLRIDVGA